MPTPPALVVRVKILISEFGALKASMASWRSPWVEFPDSETCDTFIPSKKRFKRSKAPL